MVVGNDSDEQQSERDALHGALQRLYADAVLRGDEIAAERVIRDAIDARLDQATRRLPTMSSPTMLEGDYDVRTLGADVLVDTLPGAIDRHEPAVVGLTVTMPALGAVVERAVELTRRTSPAGVMVGGAGLPSRLHADPRLVVCRRVGDAVETVDALVQRASSN